MLCSLVCLNPLKLFIKTCRWDRLADDFCRFSRNHCLELSVFMTIYVIWPVVNVLVMHRHSGFFRELNDVLFIATTMSLTGKYTGDTDNMKLLH